MKTQHTPGPWRTVLNNQDYEAFPLLIYAGAEFIAQVATDREDTESRTDDNALLIAAAPDLLAALRSIALSYPKTDEGETLTAIARTAIAKATP
jgi:hypothetical protein